MQWLNLDSSEDIASNGSSSSQSFSFKSNCSSPTSSPLPLVDLRNTEEFQSKHISFRNQINGILNPITTPVVVNLPLETLISGERSCELPPRNVPFVILVPFKNYKEETNNDLNLHLDEEIETFFLSTKSKATQQSRCRWNVNHIILESASMWNCIRDCGLLKRQIKHKCENDSDFIESSNLCLHQDNFPPPRLWCPDPLVQKYIYPTLCNFIDEIPQSTTITTKWEVWDMGCGAGRDLCFLAEECLAYYAKNHKDPKYDYIYNFPIRFIGVDNHKGSARRCLPFWKNHHVSQITDTKLLDLKKIDLLHEIWSSSKTNSSSNLNVSSSSNESNEASITKINEEYTPNAKKQRIEPSDQASISKHVRICYAIRYLNRRLLHYLVSSKCPLPKGSIFAMSHFCKSSIDAEWNFDHPKVKNVLERNELRDLFSQSVQGNRWEILQDDICLDGDHGRTLIQFVTRKL